MYVIVNHQVSNPAKFWAAAETSVPSLPASLKLHHSFPSPDGRKAVCVWEAESVDAVRAVLEPLSEGISHNEYYEAPNKEGIAMPSTPSVP